MFSFIVRIFSFILVRVFLYMVKILDFTLDIVNDWL